MMFLPNDSDIKRFFDQLIPEPNTGCWLWVGVFDRKNYGRFSYRSKEYGAHRFSFRLHKGEIPEGLLVCHKCDTPACVNPDHLFVATAKQNTADMVNKNRHWNMKKTHCKRGHPFDDENTLYTPEKRVCKTCRRARGRNETRRLRRKMSDQNSD